MGNKQSSATATTSTSKDQTEASQSEDNRKSSEGTSERITKEEGEEEGGRGKKGKQKSAVTFSEPKKPDRNASSGSRASATMQVTDALSDVRESYHINPREIGHGHYGVVRKCRDRETGEWYAIKSIRKSKVSKVDVLRREIEILREVEHPNIIRLKEIYEDDKYLHIITELCSGGELFDRIIDKTQSDEGHFSERDAAKLIRCILDAIAYCHDVKQIVHRDLKPENFLFKTKDEDADIKIIDFGLSRHDNQNFGVMKTKVGTPYYVAPEVLRREYTKSCDIWSIGVITYILLCGYPPFYGDSDTQIFDSVRAGKFDYPSPEWDTISPDAMDFINSLLKLNPADRLTASQAMKHKWIQEQTGDVASTTDDSTGIVFGSAGMTQTFKKFMGMQKLKKAALAHIAAHLTEEEIGALGDTFKKIDKDGDGVMSLEELDSALADGDFSSDVRAELKRIRENLSLSEKDKLDWKEFLASMVDKRIAMKEDNVRAAFDHFKKSDVTYISASDLIEVFGGEAQAREIMGGDMSTMKRQITYGEFKQMMADSFGEDI